MIRAACLLTTLALPAQAADLEFCWIGANGFAVAGQMSLPLETLTSPIATENDLTAFAIYGSLNGTPIGSWDMADRDQTTPWNLNFDTQTMTFVTGGLSSSDQGQQWNASGSVNDCGADGFGFNSGAGGQDVCVKNTYRIDSTIPAGTPFLAYPIGEGPTCTNGPLLGGTVVLTPPTQM